MEATYCRTSRSTIFISSHRPPGRQRYNCAHELAHHLSGTGFHVYELQESPPRGKVYDRNEFFSDIFAGFLLMPKTTVVNGFVRRGWHAGGCTPLQVHTIASWLGVGYSTLVNHMHVSLGLISDSHANELQKHSPKKLRLDLLGKDPNVHLNIVDFHWTGRPIDIQAGDLILAPPGAQYQGNGISAIQNDGCGTLLQGEYPGIFRLISPHSQWSSYVRVSRRGYIGLCKYRHLEESEDE